MAPYKDTFYSSSQETQRKNDLDTGFYMWHEPYPYTHAAVAAMTGGPILIGDGVNGSNRTLVMQTCTASGLLLKPDRPASPTDKFWLASLMNKDAASCRGDLSVTHTSLNLSTETGNPVEASGNASVATLTWLYALGVQLCVPYFLTYDEWLGAAEPFMSLPGRSMQDIYVHDQDLILNAVAPDLLAPSSVAFRPSDPVGTLVELQATGIENGSSQSIKLAAGPDYGTADFWRAAPVLPNGWALLGELDKFIGISRQRITSLTIGSPSGGDIKIKVVGTAGEIVHLSAARHERAVATSRHSVASEANDGRAVSEGSWQLCTTHVVIGSDGFAETVLPPTGSSGDCKTWNES